MVVFAGAVMATVLLAAIDWTPLETFHLGWLITIAEALLWLLWLGLVFIASSLGLVAAALRVERIEIEGGRIRRQQVLGRRSDVPIEGATLERRKRNDVITGGGKRLIAPHVFYALEELDRLWAAAGIRPPG